jgi:hypothetical protein
MFCTSFRITNSRLVRQIPNTYLSRSNTRMIRRFTSNCHLGNPILKLIITFSNTTIKKSNKGFFSIHNCHAIIITFNTHLSRDSNTILSHFFCIRLKMVVYISEKQTFSYRCCVLKQEGSVTYPQLNTGELIKNICVIFSAHPPISDNICFIRKKEKESFLLLYIIIYKHIIACNSLQFNILNLKFVTNSKRASDKYPLKTRQMSNVKYYKCDKYHI